VQFKWDEEKNRENVRKHGLDFADAIEVFGGPMLTNVDNREDYGETRFVSLGFLKNFVVAVVYTEQDEDTVRIISARKALRHERERFETAIRHGLEED
jgi:uncharacterized protein